jgi:hypothetical protein
MQGVPDHLRNPPMLPKRNPVLDHMKRMSSSNLTTEIMLPALGVAMVTIGRAMPSQPRTANVVAVENIKAGPAQTNVLKF